MNIVWFKRDLRIEDHQALFQASQTSQVLPLYILEPDLWQQPDMSHRHYLFLTQCLAELDQALQTLGQRLVIKVGDAVTVLETLRQRHTIEAVWSHQETWNTWTYQRDKAIMSWCRANAISWHQPQQNGVIRRLSSRDGWAARWHQLMAQPVIPYPKPLQSVDELSQTLPKPEQLGLTPSSYSQAQVGGRRHGTAQLQRFLYQNGEFYNKAMSSPVTAFESCSRLSPYLAFGCLSVREVFQACELRRHELKSLPAKQRGKWPRSLSAFSGRLRWHCHFMQKLEDTPEIEFYNLHPSYNDLDRHQNHPHHLHAWKTGNTGYPMIDACMRALTATGWLNFRMRAMLMSFASHHLWLHWREPALHLARLFTDYEPGIHYSQVQMQSGTTGINAIRIYNPIKQGLDHDPEGLFIRQWIPELAHIDTEFIHNPWLAKKSLGPYPLPIVDEKIARKAAADKLYGLRKHNPNHRQAADKIISKHASRRPSPRRRKKTKTTDDRQRELPL